MVDGKSHIPLDDLSNLRLSRDITQSDSSEGRQSAVMADRLYYSPTTPIKSSQENPFHDDYSIDVPAHSRYEEYDLGGIERFDADDTATDDRARLTPNAEQFNGGRRPSWTPQSRRRGILGEDLNLERDVRGLSSGLYSPTSVGRRVSHAVHIASARVVNLGTQQANNKSSSSSIPNAATTLPIKLSTGRPVYEESDITNTDLRGRTLGLFGPDNLLRGFLCSILLHPIAEPVILLVIFMHMILLTVDASYDVYSVDASRAGQRSADWAIFGVFIFYTLEIAAKVIVSGLARNPPEPGTQLPESKEDPFADPFTETDDNEPSTISFTVPQNIQNPDLDHYNRSSKIGTKAPPSRRMLQQKAQLLRLAFFRHSFNRLDFISVSAFWLYFILSSTGLEAVYHLYIFRALSCLRILRLLNITKGSSVCTVNQKVR